MSRTSKLRIKYYLCLIISFCLVWGPIIVYTALALTRPEIECPAAKKVILTCLLSVGVIASLVSLVNKYTLRCKTWLILIGLWICLDYILGVILVIAIAQILDELVFAPLTKHYRLKLTVNKELDRRNA